MRTIKFRAYNKYIKQYDSFNIQESGEFPSFLTSERHIVEQFTGLQDKNGVDIYENDLLAPLKAQVVWSDKLGCWCGRHQGQEDVTPLFMFCDNMKQLEVIGNIHD